MGITARSIDGAVSGAGTARVETARGTATLEVVVDGGEVGSAELDAPSVRNFRLIEGVTVGEELGDALVGVGSLDLSPWEMGG